MVQAQCAHIKSLRPFSRFEIQFFSTSLLPVAGRHLPFLLHILLFAGELLPLITTISLDEFHSINMSYTKQSITQSQQPARERTHTSLQQTHAPFQHRLNGFQLAQAIMNHHVEGLVVNYLEQYPGFFAGLLQKHELWLARYLREQYSLELPTRKGVVLKYPGLSHHATGPVAKRNPTGAASQGTASSSAGQIRKPDTCYPSQKLSSKAPPTVNYESFSVGPVMAQPSSQPTQRVANIQNHAAQPTSSDIHRSTKYQKPSVENVTSYESTYNGRGDSPKSTASQPSAWPSEEDLSVPYPAPKKFLDREAGLHKGKGYKWTFEEQDLAIEYMYEMRDDPNMPKTEKRFEEVSHRLKEEHGIERSKDSVKNMWNRIGRQRSKYDERKNKSAPLATSQQGKQARLDNEARRGEKRKTSEEPEPAQKKTKTSALIEPLFSEQRDRELPQYVRPTDIYNSNSMPATVHASQLELYPSEAQNIPTTTASPALLELEPDNWDSEDPFPGIDFNSTMCDEDLRKIVAFESGMDEFGLSTGFF